MLCTFLTYKEELRVLWYIVYSGRICLKGGCFCWRENPLSKNILMVSWLHHILRLSQGKIDLSLTLRKEHKCLFLCDDLIPPLFSDFSSVVCKSFRNGNQAVAGTKLVFSRVGGLWFGFFFCGFVFGWFSFVLFWRGDDLQALLPWQFSWREF